MRKLLTIVISVFAMLLAACEDADAQDVGLRTSIRRPELRVEAGKTVHAETDFLFGWDARGWASVGSVIENGQLIGSAAALFKVFAKGDVVLELGPAWLGEQRDGEFRSYFDGVLQLGIVTRPEAAFTFAVSPRGAFTLGYIGRF